MPDPRIVKLANVLVNYSIPVKAGDWFLISSTELAAPLVREVFREALKVGAHIEPRHLPPTISPDAQRTGPPPIPGSTIQDLERYAILKTLEACGGSTSKAAMILGVSTRKIQYKLHEYGAPNTDEEK